MTKSKSPSLVVRTISSEETDREPLHWHFYSRGIVDVLPSVHGDGLRIGKPDFDNGDYLPSYDNFYMTFESEYVLGKCYEILHKVPVSTSEDELRTLLKDQFRDKISEDQWEEIETEIRCFEDENVEEDDFEYRERKVFHNQSLLLAIWADLVCEPLSPPWLAAMALHAFYVAGMPFTAGYMCALIEQQEKHEADALRGKRTASSAREGGKARAQSLTKRTKAILSEMRSHINNGHGVQDAARFAHKKGIGTSPHANSKLWYRHAK